jgi:hypothetical protein
MFDTVLLNFDAVVFSQHQCGHAHLGTWHAGFQLPAEIVHPMRSDGKWLLEKCRDFFANRC